MNLPDQEILSLPHQRCLTFSMQFDDLYWAKLQEVDSSPNFRHDGTDVKEPPDEKPMLYAE